MLCYIGCNVIFWCTGSFTGTPFSLAVIDGLDGPNGLKGHNRLFRVFFGWAYSWAYSWTYIKRKVGHTLLTDFRSLVLGFRYLKYGFLICFLLELYPIIQNKNTIKKIYSVVL